MPPVPPRGMGPVRPGDFTGKRFAANTKAQMDKANDGRDIESEIKRAYDRGRDAGWDEAIAFVMESYLVYEMPNDYDE